MSGDPTGRSPGYVRLHRKLLENPLFTDKPAVWLKVWIFILLRVNYRDTIFYPKRGESMTIPAGSMVTSLDQIAMSIHLAVVEHTARHSPRHTREQVRRCLAYLEKSHAVSLRTTHHWTMITVTNWVTYQQMDKAAEHTVEQPNEQRSFGDGALPESVAATQTATHTATLSKEDKKKSTPLSNSKLDSNPVRHRKEIDPAVLDWFDKLWWPIYPRKEGKAKALEAANSKATTQDKRDYYLARLKAQLPVYEQRKRTSGQNVIPMGSTWFNQDRADDELQLSPEPGRKTQTHADDYQEYIPFAKEAR